MTVATVARAEFLKNAERQAVAEDAATLATWGEDAQVTQQSSALTRAADAATEAARQLALLKRLRGADAAVLAGCFEDLEGLTISLPYAGRFGMAAVVNFLVLASKADEATRTTTIEGEVLL